MAAFKRNKSSSSGSCNRFAASRTSLGEKFAEAIGAIGFVLPRCKFLACQNASAIGTHKTFAMPCLKGQMRNKGTIAKKLGRCEIYVPTSFLKVTPPVVMIFLHFVHLVANFSSKHETQQTSVSFGMMKGLDPTRLLQTTHWKHLSCHFLVLYSIFLVPEKYLS